MRLFVVMSLILASATATMAQGIAAGERPGVSSSALPPILREVGFDQKLNEPVPLGLTFTDEAGRTVSLGQYFGSRPVVLSLVYYGCPMLCTQTLNSLASTVGVLSQEPGKDYEMVTVSFDPREKPELALAKKAGYIERTGRPSIAEGWHFLTGAQPSIEALTRSVGFRYVWDESVQQYAHPTGVVVLTPSGRVSRYLFGIDYGPRDLRLAILDASENRISTPIERVLLYCYHYDLATGRYSLIIMRVVQLAAATTIVCLGALIFALTRRDRVRLG
jgi:protein SCO1/2